MYRSVLLLGMAGLLVAFAGGASGSGMLPAGQPCFLTVQRFVSTSGPGRWQAYQVSGALNELAGKREPWTVVPFSGRLGYWELAIRGNSMADCETFRALFERAGYEVRVTNEREFNEMKTRSVIGG